jgi:mono/diheme cytochrome c family protein
MSVLFVMAVVGCNYREPKTSKTLTNTGPTFTALREQVFKENCFTCHSGVDAAMGIDLSNYTELMKLDFGVITAGDPLNSTLYLNVQSGRMPPGGPRLSDAEIKSIFDWIKEGAKEN